MPRGHPKGYRKNCRHCIMVMQYHDARFALESVVDWRDETARPPLNFRLWLIHFDWSQLTPSTSCQEDAA